MFCKVYTVCIAYYRVYTVQCASMCDGHRTYIYGTRVEIYTQYTESTRSKFVEAAFWYDTGIYQAVNWTHKSQQYKCWFFFRLAHSKTFFAAAAAMGPMYVVLSINWTNAKDYCVCARAREQASACSPVSQWIDVWVHTVHSLLRMTSKAKQSTSLRYIFAKKHHHSCFAKLLL